MKVDYRYNLNVLPQENCKKTVLTFLPLKLNAMRRSTNAICLGSNSGISQKPHSWHYRGNCHTTVLQSPFLALPTFLMKGGFRSRSFLGLDLIMELNNLLPFQKRFPKGIFVAGHWSVSHLKVKHHYLASPPGIFHFFSS